MVADVIHYAKLIRACVLASMEQAAPTPSGVLIPEASLVTAGRLYAIEQYPKIMQVLRDLSGQGLISRVPESTWMRSDVGAMLDEFLPGHDVSARDKNRLFNLVWDLTCSGHGLRTALFEGPERHSGTRATRRPVPDPRQSGSPCGDTGARRVRLAACAAAGRSDRQRACPGHAHAAGLPSGTSAGKRFGTPWELGEAAFRRAPKRRSGVGRFSTPSSR